MKTLKRTVFIVLTVNLFLVSVSHGQELLDFLSVHQEHGEEVIMPQYDYEYIPDFTYEEVKQRIDAMDTKMPFELNETIFSFIDYFTVRNRAYSRMVLERMDFYFPIFEKALEKHQMPDEIKYLSIIESGLNPRARSRVGAMGLWQFMPATGREYKLYVNQHVDDRMDPELATEAAVKYLKALHRMFGDWEIALAAYNCGPGNVRKAIRRSGGKKTFWDLYNYLPRETRSYIPQFQAIMYVLQHTEEHNLVLEDPAFPMAYDKVNLESEVDLAHFSEISSICIEDLEELNPSILNRRIPSTHKNYALRVPKVHAKFLADNHDWIRDSLRIRSDRMLADNAGFDQKEISEHAEKIIYRVRPGDALGTIARRYNTTVAQLKDWNALHSHVIRVGQNLHIYSESPNTGNLASSSSGPKDTDPNAKVYTVQPGDSLWLISRKIEGVTIDQLKKLNNLNNNQIKPGQQLIIG